MYGCMYTQGMTNELNWNTIGKNAHMAKVANGFVHVMHLGGNVWSVTLNGRVIGKANNLKAGMALAQTHANQNA